LGFKWIGPAFISFHFPLPFAGWAQYGNWAGLALLLFFSYSRWAQYGAGLASLSITIFLIIRATRSALRLVLTVIRG
jgi:hypothetical protein